MGQLAYWLLNTDRMEGRLSSVLRLMVKKEDNRLEIMSDGSNLLIFGNNNMAK